MFSGAFSTTVNGVSSAEASVRLLKTSRLHLAPLRASDAVELFVIRGDPQAMEHWDGPPDRDAAQTREIVSGLLRAGGHPIAVLLRDGQHECGRGGRGGEELQLRCPVYANLETGQIEGHPHGGQQVATHAG